MMYLVVGLRDNPHRIAYHEVDTQPAAFALAERMYDCASFDVVQVLERPNELRFPETAPIWKRGILSSQLRLETTS